jgi:hypothetical protein
LASPSTEGNIVVAGMSSDRIERSPDGTVISVWDAPGGKIAPVDVTTDANGNVYAAGVQPNMFAVTGGTIVKLSSTGEVELKLPDAAPFDAFTFPNVAVDAAGNIYDADAWLGLLTFSADGKQLGVADRRRQRAAVAVRVAPSAASTRSPVSAPTATARSPSTRPTCRRSRAGTRPPRSTIRGPWSTSAATACTSSASALAARPSSGRPERVGRAG